MDREAASRLEMKSREGSQSFDSSCNNDSQQTSRFQVALVDDASNTDDERDEFSSPVGSFAQRTYGNNSTTMYDTRNLKSLRHYTRDALPRIDNYRNILSVHGHLVRPTIDELHGVQTTEMLESSKQPIVANATGSDGAIKFGWIQGVLVRCLLNIWGVMLFIRLSWVVAQAGIGFAFFIILLASLVTIITAISMSAICTNGEVKGGGTYFMISRSLGPEFGGSIGIIFALANAVAIAMYAVGFGETLQELLESHGIEIIGSKLMDVRLISSIAVCAMLAIALIGTEWESKAQVILLFILLSAMADFLIGSVIPPSPEQMAKGFVGWRAEVMTNNMLPEFRNESLFSVFSVFFPAATGILAGANISGDLRDAQHSIPLGTLIAIVITTISYLLFAFISGATVLRDANGLLPTNTSLESTSQLIQYLSDCSRAPLAYQNATCKYGSHNLMQVVELVSAFGPLIYAGIFAATLSSALASLVSAPKVFQSLCNDKLFPYVEYFAQGHGKNNEPRRGYILAFIIAIACCLIGDLNAIAPIISNFFLAAYCLINFSVFHASFSQSLGFRPSFRYYNMWLSLAGTVLCVAVMFIMDWVAALITFFIVIGLYIWVLYRKPDVNWGSSNQAQVYRTAITSVHKLNLLPDHVKNYRPQILLLSGFPGDRPALVDFANGITRGIGLLMCGHSLSGPVNQRIRNNLTQKATEWLFRRKVKAFYALSDDGTSIHSNSRSLMQSVGMGKLRPNLVLMGFKSDWHSCESYELLEYFNIIHETLDRYLALGILRVPGGLDTSKYSAAADIAACFEDKNGKAFLNSSLISVEVVSKSDSSDTSTNGLHAKGTDSSNSSKDSSPTASPIFSRSRPKSHAAAIAMESKEIPKEILHTVNLFSRKQKKGTIDVWWLYDDGGLTLLLPYILTTRNQWSGCKLRVFSLANKKDQLDREQRNMAALLSKFRIDYSDVTVIPNVVKPPSHETRSKFDQLIAKFRTGEANGDSAKGHPAYITDSELLALKDKINRHLRLYELVHQQSQDSTLVVMTLSMPRKGAVSAPMYLAWLEMITQNMPPFLLIRGNQTSVLTFYS